MGEVCQGGMPSCVHYQGSPVCLSIFHFPCLHFQLYIRCNILNHCTYDVRPRAIQIDGFRYTLCECIDPDQVLGSTIQEAIRNSVSLCKFGVFLYPSVFLVRVGNIGGCRSWTFLTPSTSSSVRSLISMSQDLPCMLHLHCVLHFTPLTTFVSGVDVAVLRGSSNYISEISSLDKQRPNCFEELTASILDFKFAVMRANVISAK